MSILILHPHRDAGSPSGTVQRPGTVDIASGPPHSSRRLARGEPLYGFGDPCRMLYAVQRGSLKSVAVSDDGLTQVTGFPMAGDIVGLDGIHTGAHQNEAIALEDCELTNLPCSNGTDTSTAAEDTRRIVLIALARELVRCQRLAVMLGTMRAEQRVAIFLVELAERQARLGCSRTQFHLRMQRRDIASYLGLKIETISRVFSHLQQEGMIAVEGKSIRVVDRIALELTSGVVTRAAPKGYTTHAAAHGAN